jgi:phytoene synthase
VQWADTPYVSPLIESLPLPQRLALAYAPRRRRGETLGLFALDAHLANLVRQAREPLLGQLRLAWWRDRLGERPDARPVGDVLLDLLRAWVGHEVALIALVDGWEHLLAERLDDAAVDGFAAGRARAFAGLAEQADLTEYQAPAAAAGRRWALADLAAHLGQGDERARVRDAARALGNRRIALPRALRPLTVLDGLARRSLAGDGKPLVDGPLSGLAALRLGIVGR